MIDLKYIIVKILYHFSIFTIIIIIIFIENLNTIFPLLTTLLQFVVSFKQLLYQNNVVLFVDQNNYV